MAINQEKIKNSSGQFNYLGRWVDKKHFRAFVYGKDDKQTLANNYEEYEKLISSGLWFATKEEVIKNSLITEPENHETEKNIEEFAENIQKGEPKSPKLKKFTKSFTNAG